MPSRLRQSRTVEEETEDEDDGPQNLNSPSVISLPNAPTAAKSQLGRVPPPIPNFKKPTYPINTTVNEHGSIISRPLTSALPHSNVSQEDNEWQRARAWVERSNELMEAEEARKNLETEQSLGGKADATKIKKAEEAERRAKIKLGKKFIHRTSMGGWGPIKPWEALVDEDLEAIGAALHHAQEKDRDREMTDVRLRFFKKLNPFKDRFHMNKRAAAAAKNVSDAPPRTKLTTISESTNERAKPEAGTPESHYQRALDLLEGRDYEDVGEGGEGSDTGLGINYLNATFRNSSSNMTDTENNPVEGSGIRNETSGTAGITQPKPKGKSRALDPFQHDSNTTHTAKPKNTSSGIFTITPDIDRYLQSDGPDFDPLERREVNPDHVDAASVYSDPDEVPPAPPFPRTLKVARSAQTLRFVPDRTESFYRRISEAGRRQLAHTSSHPALRGSPQPYAPFPSPACSASAQLLELVPQPLRTRNEVPEVPPRSPARMNFTGLDLEPGTNRAQAPRGRGHRRYPARIAIDMENTPLGYGESERGGLEDTTE